MATNIEDEQGKVLVENIDFTPAPGDIIEAGGKDYIVKADSPRVKQIDNGPLGKKWIKVVTAKNPAKGETGRGVPVCG